LITQLIRTVSVHVFRKMVADARVCLEDILRQNAGRSEHVAQGTPRHVSAAVVVSYVNIILHVSAAVVVIC